MLLGLGSTSSPTCSPEKRGLSPASPALRLPTLDGAGEGMALQTLSRCRERFPLLGTTEADGAGAGAAVCCPTPGQPPTSVFLRLDLGPKPTDKAAFSSPAGKGAQHRSRVPGSLRRSLYGGAH